MTKYREILRLKSLGFSERNIAQSCGVSRNTVAKVLKKAAEIKLSWPLDFDMTDSALEELMFPKDKSATNKRMPNFDYIRKELLRNGVNKKLLWVEYCEECRMSSEEPLMYSQFCYYIQKDEEKRRAIEMRLTAMADAFRIQINDPAMKEVPFEDRFGMLIDVEYSNRKNNRLKRLIRQAEFEQPDASIAAIDYHSGRKLNKALINRLATCEYITEYRNIFITGATGSGKTYMACAFGMEACKHYYSVRYVRLPDSTFSLTPQCHITLAISHYMIFSSAPVKTSTD